MSKRVHVAGLVSGLVVVVGAGAASALASVTVPDVQVIVRSSASAGRLGSTTGTLTDERQVDNARAPVAGLTIVRQTSVVAGPVAPGQGPSLPGTAAVVQTGGTTQFVVTPAGNVTTLQIVMNANNSFASMDGGIVVGSSSNVLDAEFRVDAPTPYAMTGTLALDDQDVTGLLQLQGTTILLSRLNNGPVSRSGTLQPGTYRLRATCGVSESISASGVFAEAGSMNITLTLQAPLAWPGCDGIDFNGNGVFPEDQDVIDFFNVLAGETCATCADIDFNNNGVFPEDQDVVDFFTVLAGGACTQ